MNLRRKELRRVPRRYQDDGPPASPLKPSAGEIPDGRNGNSELPPYNRVPQPASLNPPKKNGESAHSTSPLENMANGKRVRAGNKSKGPREKQPRKRPPKIRPTQPELEPDEELRNSLEQSLSIRSRSATPPGDFRAAQPAAFPSLTDVPRPSSPNRPCGLDALSLLEDRHATDPGRREKSYETVDNMYSSKAFPDDLRRVQKRWYLSLKMRPDMAAPRSNIPFSSLYYSLRQTIMDQIREQVPRGTFDDFRYPFFRLLDINAAEFGMILLVNAQGWPDDVDIPPHLAEMRRLHPDMVLDPELPPPMDLIKAVHFLMQRHLPGSLLGEWQFKLPNPAEILEAVPAPESPCIPATDSEPAHTHRTTTLDGARVEGGGNVAVAGISQNASAAPTRAPKAATPTLPSLQDQLRTAASTAQLDMENSTEPRRPHPSPTNGGLTIKGGSPAQAKRPKLADDSMRRQSPAAPTWTPRTQNLPPNATPNSNGGMQMHPLPTAYHVETPYTGPAQPIPPFGHPLMQHPPTQYQTTQPPPISYPNLSTYTSPTPFGPAMYGRGTANAHGREAVEGMNPYQQAVRDRVPLYDPVRERFAEGPQGSVQGQAGSNAPRTLAAHVLQHHGPQNGRQNQYQGPQNGGHIQHQNRHGEAQGSQNGGDGMDVDKEREMAIDPAITGSGQPNGNGNGNGNGNCNGMVTLHTLKDVERYMKK